VVRQFEVARANQGHNGRDELQWRSNLALRRRFWPDRKIRAPVGRRHHVPVRLLALLSSVEPGSSYVQDHVFLRVPLEKDGRG